MDTLWTPLLWMYLAGLVFFFLIGDESPLPRLGVAIIWPVPVGVFLLVVFLLLIAACVSWWPLAVILAGAGGLAVWMLAVWW